MENNLSITYLYKIIHINSLEIIEIVIRLRMIRFNNTVTNHDLYY